MSLFVWESNSVINYIVVCIFQASSGLLEVMCFQAQTMPARHLGTWQEAAQTIAEAEGSQSLAAVPTFVRCAEQ